MGQVKIYGLTEHLNTNKTKMSEIIHTSIVEAFKFPKDKKFQRFFPMAKDNFYFPADRTEKYTIIELSIFEGRSKEAKKEFIKLIYSSFKEQLNIQENDIEITIFETPKCNWGIRGMSGDELMLNYKVDV